MNDPGDFASFFGLVTISMECGNIERGSVVDRADVRNLSMLDRALHFLHHSRVCRCGNDCSSIRELHETDIGWCCQSCGQEKNCPAESVQSEECDDCIERGLCQQCHHGSIMCIWILSIMISFEVLSVIWGQARTAGLRPCS